MYKYIHQEGTTVKRRQDKRRMHGMCDTCDRGKSRRMKMDDTNFQCLFLSLSYIPNRNKTVVSFNLHV